MKREFRYAHDPRFATLKAQLVRKVHVDLPYAIRFLNRMDRLGQRVCATEVRAIVDELRTALLQEVGDVVRDRRASAV
ncbi:MAG TPA: hypothetical protein VNT75_32685 [Symbiobacteriaceae bacterium]|nr:hypothetical protein [Symbiobacteriaceae bacterium]